MVATSSGSINRCSSDVARCLRKKSASICAAGASGAAAVLLRKSTMPSDCVGPGKTEFTVTFVPLVNPAKPRATESCAVLVMP